MDQANIFNDEASPAPGGLIVDELGSHAGVERTSSGGWIVPATLTRTGLFKYVEGGKSITVLRPKEEVFHPESVASLEHCPVTVFHPAEREVTPKNYRRVVRGTVGRTTVLKNKYLASRLRIEDEDTGEKIDSKELCEISCGYRAEYALNTDGSFVTGEYEGKPYDRMQINIRYNHVSLGPKGWGRAGSDVGIKLDGVDAYVSGMDNVLASQTFNDEAAPVPVPAPVVTIDSIPRAEFDKLQAKFDMLALQFAARPAPAPVVTIDAAAVAARVALVADAKVLAPTLVVDTLSDENVRLFALKEAGVNVTGKSTAYVDAAFDLAVAQRKTVIDSHQAVAGVTRTAAVVVDETPDPLLKAYADNVAAYKRA